MVSRGQESVRNSWLKVVQRLDCRLQVRRFRVLSWRIFWGGGSAWSLYILPLSAWLQSHSPKTCVWGGGELPSRLWQHPLTLVDSHKRFKTIVLVFQLQTEHSAVKKHIFIYFYLTSLLVCMCSTKSNQISVGTNGLWPKKIWVVVIILCLLLTWMMYI